MEAREITIVSTRDQKKSVIMSSATTLAELKADLAANNIDYSGMTFYEGTSKTELVSDDSALPTNVPYKGETTNKLVFMLTNTNKKIRSGAMSRQEIYKTIKKMGLQNDCLKKLGKPYSMCKTVDLIAFLEGFKASKKATAKKPATSAITTTTDEKKAIIALVNALVANNTLNIYEANGILLHLNEKIEAPKGSSYSDDEIDDMFADVC